MKPNVFSRLNFVVITGFISSYKIFVGVIYIILLCVMSIEVTCETRVRTDCLNFDVSLCIAYKVKNKFQLGEEGIGIIFLWDFRSRYSSRLHKITNKCTPSINERYHQRSMLPALRKTSCATKKVFHILMFSLQKKI